MFNISLDNCSAAYFTFDFRVCGFGPLSIVIVIMTDHIAEFNFWSSRCSQYLNWWLSFSLFNFHIDKSQNLFSAFLACAHGPLLSSSGKFHNPRSLYFSALYARRNVYRCPFSYLGNPKRGWMALERQDRQGARAIDPGRMRDRQFEAGVGLGLTEAASVAMRNRAVLKCRHSFGGQQNSTECSVK